VKGHGEICGVSVKSETAEIAKIAEIANQKTEEKTALSLGVERLRGGGAEGRWAVKSAKVGKWESGRLGDWRLEMGDWVEGRRVENQGSGKSRGRLL
jgi:hypothetical protein